MCFSASASFTTSAIVGGIGLLSLYEIRNKSKRALPFIIIQFLFAIQQGMEGITWLTYNNLSLLWLQKITSYGFYIIAACIWPILFPFSVYLIENQTSRKKWFLVTVILGCIFSILVMYFKVLKGISVNIRCCHVEYLSLQNSSSDLLAWGAYVTLVILPTFISKVKGMKLIAISGVLSLIIGIIISVDATFSLWCFFAALSSLLLYRVIKMLPNKS